jgi:hypothetical protein
MLAQWTIGHPERQLFMDYFEDAFNLLVRWSSAHPKPEGLLVARHASSVLRNFVASGCENPRPFRQSQASGRSPATFRSGRRRWALRILAGFAFRIFELR